MKIYLSLYNTVSIKAFIYFFSKKHCEIFGVLGIVASSESCPNISNALSVTNI